jgi:hypothetical protein
MIVKFLYTISVLNVMTKIKVVIKYLFCTRFQVRRKNIQPQLWKLSMQML